MKKLDIIVMIFFVAGLVALCFFQECRMDGYFLVLGFAVAAMSFVSMVIQWRKDAEQEAEQSNE